jgi:hypothetical protein
MKVMAIRNRAALSRSLVLIALIAAVILPLPAAAQPVAATSGCVLAPSGITAWWPGEGNANDLVGSNIGTLHGATFGPGEVGQAFSFDGVDDYVSFPDSPSLNVGTSDFSLDGWIKTTSTGVLQSIVDKRQAVGTDGYIGYTMYVDPSYGLSFQMANGIGFTNFNSNNLTSQDGQWHHIAVTVVRSSTTGGNLYIDGQVVLTFDPTPYAGDLDNTSAFWLGAHLFAYPAFSFQGEIDEFDFYQRALSASQIAAIYSAGSAGKCPLMLTPATGPVGQTVSASGSGFPANAAITLKMQIGTSSVVLTTGPCTADSSGAFANCAFTIPRATGGAHNVYASNGTSTASTTFTVTPSITLARGATGTPGSTISATGTGFAASTTVAVTIGGVTSPTVCTTDVHGSISNCAVTIPTVYTFAASDGSGDSAHQSITLK